MTPGLAIMERLDPFTAAASRPVTRALAVGAVLVAFVGVAFAVERVRTPFWLLVALVALVAAAGMIARCARHRSPWCTMVRRGALLPVLLATVLIAASAASFSDVVHLRDDWSPFAVGLCVMALAPYRPPREIALLTAALVITGATLSLAQVSAGTLESPAPIAMVAGSLPIAVLGFAGAAYAASINGAIIDWHDRAWRSAADTALASRGGIARSVQQDRITLLNRDVVPYLARIALTEDLTETDRAEARALAVSIRESLVGEVEKGWAQAMLAELAARRASARVAVRADDPDDLGRSASLPHRTLLRAVATQLVESGGCAEVGLRLRRIEGRLCAEYDARSTLSFEEARRALEPILDVVRGLAEGCRLREQGGRLTLEFHYGH